MHDDGRTSVRAARRWRWRRRIRRMAVQQFRQPGFQRGSDAFDVVQADIMLGALDGADIAAVETAEFGENFL